MRKIGTSAWAGHPDLVDLTQTLGSAWLAAATLTGVVWKLRMDRRAALHGGKAQDRTRSPRGPLSAWAATPSFEPADQSQRIRRASGRSISE
jgi:hypothetical protein